MTIVERVDASVDFEFPRKDNTLTLEELEKYLINARMRGAGEQDTVNFTVRCTHYDYSTPHDLVTKMSVSVPAEMGGYAPTNSEALIVPTKSRFHKRTQAKIILGSAAVTPLLALGGVLKAVL